MEKKTELQCILFIEHEQYVYKSEQINILLLYTDEVENFNKNNALQRALWLAVSTIGGDSSDKASSKSNSLVSSWKSQRSWIRSGIKDFKFKQNYRPS